MYMYLNFGFYTLTWRAKVRARDSCTIPISCITYLRLSVYRTAPCSVPCARTVGGTQEILILSCHDKPGRRMPLAAISLVFLSCLSS